MSETNSNLVELIANEMLASLPFGRKLKVAMIVGLSINKLPDAPSLDDEEFHQAVDAALDLLVAHPEVQSFGDIHNWRYSEISRELADGRLDANSARKILLTLDEFGQPITALSEVLRQIEDEEVRRYLLRVLGDVMGILDGKIGRMARRASGRGE